MTTAAEISVSPPAPWGNRTKLLPKSMRYALSLDLTATVQGSYLRVKPSAKGSIRHLLDHAIVVMPEGLRCDVPVGEIESGDGELGTPDDPSSSDLVIRLRVKVGSAAERDRPPVTMNIECLGSVSFNGGTEGFQTGVGAEAVGSAFIATYHEVARPSFRWLARRQLFGIGRVTEWQERGERLLSFSFDLYAAA